jgi:hypothetical protein
MAIALWWLANVLCYTPTSSFFSPFVNLPLSLRVSSEKHITISQRDTMSENQHSLWQEIYLAIRFYGILTVAKFQWAFEIF